MSEDLTDYLLESGLPAFRYLHSNIDTIERIESFRDLVSESSTVLVGINLLPKVSTFRGLPRRDP